MRFFKKPWFQRFAERESIPDESLKTLATELEAGTVHANLGGDVYKQRLARTGSGKSDGYRVVLFFRAGNRVFLPSPLPSLGRRISISESWLS